MEKCHTHVTNILEKRSNNPALETLFIKFGPVKMRTISREVMNTISEAQ